MDLKKAPSSGFGGVKDLEWCSQVGICIWDGDEDWNQRLAGVLGSRLWVREESVVNKQAPGTRRKECTLVLGCWKCALDTKKTKGTLDDRCWEFLSWT